MSHLLQLLRKPISWFFIIFIIIILSLSFKLPFQHDYYLYTLMWHNFLVTGHPYVTSEGIFNDNAYGPLFIVLSALFYLHPSLPRFLFVACWLILSGFLLKLAVKNNLPKMYKKLVVCVCFFNPFFIVLYTIFGINEIIMAATVLITVYLLDRNEDAKSGFILACGVLFKFMPIFIVPFLFFGKNKFRWRFILYFIVTCCVVYGLSIILWQNEIFIPLKFATSRDSTFLSLFFFFRSVLGINIDWASTPSLLVSLALLFFVHLKKRFNTASISILILLMVVFFYKVDHPQYHTTIILMIVYWFIENFKKITSMKTKIYYIGGYYLYISAVPLFYLIFNQFQNKWFFLRQWSSIPLAILMVVAFSSILFFEFQNIHEKIKSIV